MSLILEALRKSEAERRRGEAPDLRVELSPPPPPKRRPPALAWLAGGLALALLVAWLWPRNEQGGVAADGDPGRTRAGHAAAIRESDDVEGLQDVPARSGRRDADVAARRGPSGGDNARAVFPAVERIEVPGGTVAPEPAPDMLLAPPPMAARAAEEAAQDEAAMQVHAAGAGRKRAGASTLPATPPAPEASPPAAAPASAPLSSDTAIRITGLPSSQRERLPEARLSLHMWNEEPARRFAVIDGQRRIEGDRLGEATIVAIDRDGVLLDLEGQLVRLPLP